MDTLTDSSFPLLCSVTLIAGVDYSAVMSVVEAVFTIGILYQVW